MKKFLTHPTWEKDAAEKICGADGYSKLQSIFKHH